MSAGLAELMQKLYGNTNNTNKIGITTTVN